MGSIQSYRREFDAAEASLADAIDLAELSGQVLLAGFAHHNLGHIRALRGDAPAALAEFEVAMERYEALGAPADKVASLMADRARTLADAGLHREAVESVDIAYELVRDGANTTEAADIALLTAQIRLGGDEPDSAVGPAQWARDAYAEQGRTGWIPFAEFLCVQALTGTRPMTNEPQQRSPSPWTSNAPVGSRRRRTPSSSRPSTFAERGDTGAARAVLGDAVRLDAVTLKSRSARWLAMARQHVLDDDLDAARIAVDAGLDLLAANRSMLGAVELLSRSIEAGADLTRLGVEVELRRQNPAGVLEVLRRAVEVERTPGSSDAPDEQLAAWLAELRHTVNDVRTIDQGSEQRVKLRRRQAELERWIRDRSRQATGNARRRRRPDPANGTKPVADRIVTLATSDDEVVTIIVAEGRPELWRTSPPRPLRHLVETVDFALHRLNRAVVSPASMEVATKMLNEAGAELDAILVPDGIRRTTHPIVMTPSDVLHGLAWRVLPSLRNRSLTVSTTLGDPPTRQEHRRTLLVAGPDLDHADAEVREIQPIGTAVMVASHESTVERVVAEIGQCDLAHIACHGSFRADNPLFSALHLADGDLTIYELQRCPSLPQTVILSACNAGQSAVLRGGALLGMANALLQMGVNSVIAPLSPVSDERLVPIMVGLHQRLAAGADAASALAAVSVDATGRLDPTAAAFVCFGR